MITLESCPICSGDRITQFRQAGIAPRVIHEIMPGVKVNAAVISRYSVCQSCNLIFQNPRMSDSELNKFYSQGVYRKTLNLTAEQKDKDELYRTKIDSEIIKRYVGKVKSHLDIGCSRGYLLDEIGAIVKAGVEAGIDDVTVKGIKIYAKMSQVSHKKFDLVTAIHVLEHVGKPLDYLKTMSKFIGKDGYLVVEVPTWKSPASTPSTRPSSPTSCASTTSRPS